jgi:CcmD family protein
MADQFRADGKIYVVIAVVSIILAGFFVYLFRLDRKITNLENRLK